MSDIMKKLNLNNMFPNDVSDGYTYRHLTNFSANYIELYTKVVSTFDFESTFKDKVSMRIIDNATTVDGVALDDYYALYVIYPIKTHETSAEEIALFATLEKLRKWIVHDPAHNMDNPLDGIGIPDMITLGDDPCPDLGFFWRYFDMVRDTEYPHLKFRV